MSTLIICASALLISHLGVARLRQLAHDRQWLAVPDERSSHQVATPTGGGLVIVIVTLLSAALVWLLNPDWDIPSIAVYMVVAILVAFVGWMDDLYALSARLRFNVHLVSAVVIMFCVP